MKIKKIFIGLVALLCLGSITSCGEIPTTSVTTSPSITDTSTQASFIDYTAKDACRLKLDYKDASGNSRKFASDGIAQVTLKTPIDGDTAHFYDTEHTDSSIYVIKSRFWGIDTPESTGKIQEWGLPASNFTKKILKNANQNGTIVVSSPSSTYGAPSPDSTGSRYVSLIWINETVKNAAYTDLILLNLYIVQEGYSWVKNVADIPAYSDIFYEAEAQSKDFRLNLHSGERDPLFNYEGYKDASLLEIKNEIIATINDSTHVNAFAGENVRVEGVVAGFANNILYIQSYFSKEQGSEKEGGEWAGINIFTGASSIPTKFKTVNNYIRLCGTCVDSETFGFQISGASFKTLASSDTDAVVLYYDTNADSTKVTPDELRVHTTESTLTQISSDVYGTPRVLDYLYSPVKLTTQVTCTGGYLSDSGDAITLYVTDNETRNEVNIYIAFMYYGDPDKTSDPWKTIDRFQNKTFSVSGILSWHKTVKDDGTIKHKFQILPRSGSDLICTNL